MDPTELKETVERLNSLLDEYFYYLSTSLVYSHKEIVFWRYSWFIFFGILLSSIYLTSGDIILRKNKDEVFKILFSKSNSVRVQVC